MPAPFPTDLARALAKAELHVHLEGSVDPATMLVLADRHGVAPPAVDVDGMRDWLRFDGFPRFLERYFWVCGLLRTADDFADVAAAYLRAAHDQGAVHVEFHVSSSYHIVERGADWSEVLSGVVAGCERAESEVGISSLLIPDLSPHLGADAAHRALDVVLAELHPRIVAVGLGGPADNWTTEDFGSAFVRAREAGLHTVSHAGEHGPAWEVRHALEEGTRIRSESFAVHVGLGAPASASTSAVAAPVAGLGRSCSTDRTLFTSRWGAYGFCRKQPMPSTPKRFMASPSG